MYGRNQTDLKTSIETAGAQPQELMQAEVVQHPNKVEIRLAAAFDLWRLLHLQTFLVADASQRRTVVNRRRRELSRIHEQYDVVDVHSLRRVEALDLDKQPVMDLTVDWRRRA